MTFDVGQLVRSKIYSKDGDEMGMVDEVFCEPGEMEPSWIGAQRGLLRNKWTLIPLKDADVQGRQVEVAFSTSQVDRAPEVPGPEISPHDVRRLASHYGLPKAERDSGGLRPRALRDEPPAAEAVYHVVHGEEGWKAVEEGTDRVLASGGRKDDVLRDARERARSDGARLVVHRADGTIQDERSFGDARR